MDGLKREVLDELDSRIERLHQHENDEKPSNGNEYEALNHALSHVIGTSLEKELTNLRGFVDEL